MDQITIPNHLFFAQVVDQLQARRSVKLRIHGHSMTPFLIHDRDDFILQPISDCGLRRLDVVLARIQTPQGPTYILHRVVRLRPYGVVLRGDGNIRGTEYCELSDVVAVVTLVVRKPSSPHARTTDTQSLPWRLLSWLWWFLFPIRRGLLYLYRHLLRP